MKEGRSTEEEKRTFLPSAVSVPLNPLFRCDRQCSEKTLSYWQLASVVVNEGDGAYDQPVSEVFHCRQKEKNRCQMCSGGRLWKRRRIGEGCGK